MALFDKYYIPDNLPVSWLEREYKISADDLLLVSTPNKETETEYMSKYVKMDDLSGQMLCSVFKRLEELENTLCEVCSMIDDSNGNTGWTLASINPPYIISAIHETNGSIDNLSAYPLRTGMQYEFNNYTFPTAHFNNLTVNYPIVGPLISGYDGQLPFLRPAGINKHEVLDGRLICQTAAEVETCKAGINSAHPTMTEAQCKSYRIYLLNKDGSYAKGTYQREQTGTTWSLINTDPGNDDYLQAGTLHRNWYTLKTYYLNVSRAFTLVSQPSTNTTTTVQNPYILPAATSDALGGIKIWTGTITEYNAIASKDNDTLYFVHN